MTRFLLTAWADAFDVDLPHPDAEHAVALGLEERRLRLAIAGLGEAERGAERRVSAQAVQPRIAREERPAEKAAFDGSTDVIDGERVAGGSASAT